MVHKIINLLHLNNIFFGFYLDLLYSQISKLILFVTILLFIIDLLSWNRYQYYHQLYSSIHSRYVVNLLSQQLYFSLFIPNSTQKFVIILPLLHYLDQYLFFNRQPLNLKYFWLKYYNFCTHSKQEPNLVSKNFV